MDDDLRVITEAQEEQMVVLCGPILPRGSVVVAMETIQRPLYAVQPHPQGRVL